MTGLAIGICAGALMLSHGAAAACLADGQAITGTLKWESLTAPQGKPIPAPFLILAAAACAGKNGEAHGTRVQLMLDGVDPLQGVHEGDTLTVTGEYRPPGDRFETGDIVAVRARIMTAH